MTNYYIKNGRLYLEWENETAYFTADMLASAANVSIQTAYKWLSGKHTPDPTRISLLFYDTFGMIPRATDYRIIDDHIHHQSIKRPIPLNHLTMWDTLLSSDLVAQADHRKLIESNKVLAIENKELRHQLDGFLLQLVSESDSLDIAFALREFMQKRLNSTH
jgi:hypothetical protein